MTQEKQFSLHCQDCCSAAVFFDDIDSAITAFKKHYADGNHHRCAILSPGIYPSNKSEDGK